MTEEKVKLTTGVLGARCLQAVLPNWIEQGGVGGYHKLHVGEMHELLRVRGEDREGMKPQLLE